MAGYSEPWRVKHDTEIVTREHTEEATGSVKRKHHLGGLRRHAHRAVDCVNACTGLEFEGDDSTGCVEELRRAGAFARNIIDTYYKPEYAEHTDVALERLNAALARFTTNGDS